ncbi:N-acetylglucosamine-6-phosphate deacetylase [Kistimonas scapharcae]|uniref:N-acetylglucosamine-6-phosphate deacetylase n=1 Tax=Kistimonas scapharcae TaxID=1036133 RepID=A0ABP8UZR0_9GAMM
MNIEQADTFALTDGIIVSVSAILENHAVIISEGSIDSIVPDDQLPAGMTTHSLGGQWLCPGFIDLQLNGCGGVLFNSDISTGTLDTMHQTNLRHGCTSFLPTLITADDNDIQHAISVTREYKNRHPFHVPGLHLEGPWLNPNRKGIHDPAHVRRPDADLLRLMCDNSNTISMVTLAPEVCPPGTIEQLTEAGIRVAIGHTAATSAEVEQAIKAGAAFATHLFNAMPPLTNREPGPVGAILDDPHICAGIIADGVHVNWQNIRLAWRLLGSKRLCLVTDATPAAGTQIDQFQFGGQTVYYRDGKCISAEGTICGSALTMDAAVKHSVEHVHIPLTEAVCMATATPARSIGMDDHIGQIKPDMQANLTVLNQDYSVTATISDGQLIDWSNGTLNGQ